MHFLLLFQIFYFLLLCYSECLCLPSLGCCLLALRIPLFYFVNCLRCIPFDERLLDILNFVSTKDTATKVVYIYSCGSSVKYSTMAWKRATFVLFSFCPICKQIRDRKSESKRMADEGGGGHDDDGFGHKPFVPPSPAVTRVRNANQETAHGSNSSSSSSVAQLGIREGRLTEGKRGSSRRRYL